MASNKKGKVIQLLSPENYIRQRSRSLPIHECWINSEWEEDKKVNLIISRKHTNGNLTVGLFMVDLLCLGVKDAHYKFNIPAGEYRELLEFMEERLPIERIDYALAHNIIHAGVEYAEEYGFKPHKDYLSTMQYFLENDDDIEVIEIECGENDQPMYVRGPFDSDAEVNRVLAQLERTAGKGNYQFVVEEDDSLFDDDEEYENFDDEDYDGFGDEDWEDDDSQLEAVLKEKSPGLQFKIQLQDITEPPVWRRVIVPSHYTFHLFHEIIQDVFGWYDQHKYLFSPKGYKSFPMIEESMEEPIMGGQSWESSKVLLSDIFTQEGQQFTYIYDPGDDWTHQIILEKIIPKEINKPACTDGEGQCPPEDCGGFYGYERLKAIMADPLRPEHAGMKEWLELEEDETWGPNAFDLQEVQEELSIYYSLK